MSRFFVGNLDYNLSEQDLVEGLVGVGLTVSSVKIVLDRETGQSRGFGFFEELSGRSEDDVIAAANGVQIGRRAINVNIATERKQSPAGRGGGGQGRGGRDRRDRDRW